MPTLGAPLDLAKYEAKQPQSTHSGSRAIVTGHGSDVLQLGRQHPVLVRRNRHGLLPSPEPLLLTPLLPRRASFSLLVT